MATPDAKPEEPVTIMITRSERNDILRYGYPFEDIENQLNSAGDVDIMRITDCPYWWERVIVNLHISEKENAKYPEIVANLWSLIDRIAEEIGLV